MEMMEEVEELLGTAFTAACTLVYWPPLFATVIVTAACAGGAAQKVANAARAVLQVQARLKRVRADTRMWAIHEKRSRRLRAGHPHTRQAVDGRTGRPPVKLKQRRTAVNGPPPNPPPLPALLRRRHSALPLSAADQRRRGRRSHARHGDLSQPQVVAERVAEPAVDAVRLLLRLLDELHAARAQRLVLGLAVLGGQEH